MKYNSEANAILVTHLPLGYNRICDSKIQSIQCRYAIP